jgi:hypothetical protein
VGDNLKALDALDNRLGGDNARKVDSVIPGLVTDSNAYLRMLGVLCLGAIDDLPHLVEALNDDDHAEVRTVAIFVLRNWMSRSADPGKEANAQALELYAALEKKYGPIVAETVMELLHSYSQKETEDPATWDTLIEYLNSPKLPIRELASWQLRSMLPYLLPKIPPYNLGLGSAQSDNAYKAWKGLIPDGKLPPPPPQPAAPAPAGAPPPAAGK